ncbi:GNAT family N-acetyltransferase [Mesorhizobium sp. NBSH29]|uniref:GNAT family N-acetyltransferase n=1 Tax=Mesorhizobium sp. NBSH29 TaxID=2654249 RepID=UPI00189654B2|nr:GNAT family N-acetyltransferase [Mesorhizobium sp. NBSH29]QPC87786.1 GNAT family N-acetyltransferase [Mesorhizobium sp. NBSH29]
MIVDLGDGYVLRQASAADDAALKMICLKTGDAGADASAREDAPDLLGLIYTVPYRHFEPELAFIIEGPVGPAGYLLGARNSVAFNLRLANDWYPGMRLAHTDPGNKLSLWEGSDWARHWIHHPDLAVPEVLATRYPSHGHIDLLPQARGRGIGRRAMRFLEERLGEGGSPGLYLEVAPENSSALRFYETLGYVQLQGADVPRRCIFMVKTLAR